MSITSSAPCGHASGLRLSAGLPADWGDHGVLAGFSGRSFHTFENHGALLQLQYTGWPAMAELVDRRGRPSTHLCCSVQKRPQWRRRCGCSPTGTWLSLLPQPMRRYRDPWLRSPFIPPSAPNPMPLRPLMPRRTARLDLEGPMAPTQASCLICRSVRWPTSSRFTREAASVQAESLAGRPHRWR